MCVIERDRKVVLIDRFDEIAALQAECQDLAKKNDILEAAYLDLFARHNGISPTCKCSICQDRMQEAREALAKLKEAA